MANFKFWTTDEETELRSLIEEGYDIPELVELFSNTLNRTESSVKNKIYNLLDVMPECKAAMLDKRKVARAATKIALKKEEVKPIEKHLDLKALVASKIEIVDVKMRKKEMIFPIVARHSINRHIVLFTSMHRGVVLHAGNSSLFAGYCNDSLAACNDTLQWEILDEVTLTFKS